MFSIFVTLVSFSSGQDIFQISGQTQRGERYGNFMKSILLILMILSLHVFAQKDILTANGQFNCVLTPDKESYNLGETPNITVEIKNNSKKPAYLVRALDGSECKWRFPYAYFTISKIGDTSYKTRSYGRCGNMDEINSRDFVEVKPRASFNPYRQTSPNSDGENIYAYDFKLKDKNNFLEPGKYLITFFYSTMETDFSKWRGRLAGALKDEEYKKMVSLFSKVVHQEIRSNALTLEIK